MDKPKTLLEDLCEQALSAGADSLEVEYKDSRLWVFAFKGPMGFGIAGFAASSDEAGELHASLYAARRKAIRTAIGDRLWLAKVQTFDSFGEDAFRMHFKPARKPA
jgi:hypothetical protein